MPVKKTPKSVLVTFKKWECQSDFSFESSKGGRITLLTCDVCTKDEREIRREARFRGQVPEVGH